MPLNKAFMKDLKDITVTADTVGVPEGLGSIIAGHPFDTVKVRLQTVGTIDFGDGEFLYNGPVDCFHKIVRREGFSSLYKGIALPLISVVPTNILMFYVYNKMAVTQTLSSTVKLTRKDVLFDGCISGMLPAAVICPVERIKVFLQIPRGFYPEIQTASDIIKKIYHEEGVPGMFRGVYLTAFRDGFSTGVAFLAYYWLKFNILKNSPLLQTSNREQKKRYKYLGMGISGGTAGVISTAITIPIDFIKTRYQIKREDFNEMLINIRDEADRRQISVIRLSYTGTSLILIKSFVQFSLTFLGFELYMELLRREKVLKREREHKKHEDEKNELIEKEIEELEEIEDSIYEDI